MSEKRFIVGGDGIFRKGEKLYSDDEIAQIINEQQSTIEEQNKEIEEFSAFIIEQRKEIKTLKEENEQLRQKLDFYLLDEFEWKEKYGDVLDE